MSRLFRFVPALAALLLGGLLTALGEHQVLIRSFGVAAILASVSLVGWAQLSSRSALPDEVNTVQRSRRLVVICIALIVISTAAIFYMVLTGHAASSLTMIMAGFDLALLAAVINYVLKRRQSDRA